MGYKGCFFFQAEDGIRDAHEWLEYRRVLFRSRRPGLGIRSGDGPGLMPTGRSAAALRPRLHHPHFVHVELDALAVAVDFAAQFDLGLVVDFHAGGEIVIVDVDADAARAVVDSVVIVAVARDDAARSAEHTS